MAIARSRSTKVAVALRSDSSSAVGNESSSRAKPPFFKDATARFCGSVPAGAAAALSEMLSGRTLTCGRSLGPLLAADAVFAWMAAEAATSWLSSVVTAILVTRLISLSDRGSGGGGLLAGHRASSAAAISTAPDRATVDATGKEDFASEDVVFDGGLRLGMLVDHTRVMSETSFAVGDSTRHTTEIGKQIQVRPICVGVLLMNTFPGKSSAHAGALLRALAHDLFGYHHA